jgi:hypothetical protein
MVGARLEADGVVLVATEILRSGTSMWRCCWSVRPSVKNDGSYGLTLVIGYEAFLSSTLL